MLEVEEEQQQDGDRSFVEKRPGKERAETGVTPFAIEICGSIHRAFVGEGEPIEIGFGK